MSRLSTLDVELIKVCMLGESDNTLLFQKEAPINGMKSHIDMILLLRVQILEHSISAYQAHRITVFLNPDVLGHACLVLGSLLPMIKPNPKQSDKVATQRVFDLARLSSSYLEYIICALDRVLRERKPSTAGQCVVMLKGMIRGERITMKINQTLQQFCLISSYVISKGLQTQVLHFRSERSLASLAVSTRRDFSGEH
ncbi:hypothetical protein MHU86_22267 [Fragilaria crotonensis]|nr:hypothetical protein MHU86_22267 [Fragilaria crotonensis]